MTAVFLPVEITELIVDWLEYESDINALARTSRALYRSVNPRLYRHNVRHGESSALGWGIQHGFLGTVQQSVEAGASVNECDPEILWRPMALAVTEGYEVIVRYLYEQGVEIRHTRKWFNPRYEDYRHLKHRETLLSLAAHYGHDPLVCFFIDHLPWPYHVDFPRSMYGQTPLWNAANEGHLAIVQRLVDAGADIHARDQGRRTPFMAAAMSGNRDIMQFLAQRGADPAATDCKGCSSLCTAAMNGHLDVVRYLLELDVIAELTRRQSSEPSSHHPTICPLELSTSWGHNDVTDLLLKSWDHLAGLVEPTDMTGLLCAAAWRGNLSLVQDLLESHGCDANGRFIANRSETHKRPTAICWAVAGGHTEIVKVLLAHGAEVYVATAWHERLISEPLFEAIKQGSETIVAMLLLACANPNDHDERFNLMVQSNLKHAYPFEEVLRCLLAAGADLFAVDSYGDSQVDFILRSGNVATVRMLIDQGLDLPHHVRHNNLLDPAIDGGHTVLQLLVNTGKWNTLLLPDHLDPLICEKALERAVSRGKIPTLQWLLDQGFLKRAQSPPTVNLLACAACTRDVPDTKAADIVDLLLQHGLDINETIDNRTALMCLAKHHDCFIPPNSCRDRMLMLLNRGANLLPPQSLPQATRYESSRVENIGLNTDLDEMIFQELEARREPWTLVEHLFQFAEYRARFRTDIDGCLDTRALKIIRQFSWRLQYPV